MTEGDLAWPVASGLCDMPADLSAPLAALAQQTAIEWLWELSGRVYGTRSVAYRPQTRLLTGCASDWPSILVPIWGPLWGRGWPFDGDPRNPYDLAAKQVVELPSPVVGPSSAFPVTVDIWDPTTGAHTAMSWADSPALFRIEGNYLVRQDGGQWPETQNLVAELGTPNTWEVSFSRGYEVPVMGQVCAALLGCQFGKKFLGDRSVAIPANTVQVTRAGVAINRDVLKAAKTTGIDEVDRWVASVNPNGLQQAPQVWSPDTVRNARPFAGSYRPAG